MPTYLPTYRPTCLPTYLPAYIPTYLRLTVHLSLPKTYTRNQFTRLPPVRSLLHQCYTVRTEFRFHAHFVSGVTKIIYGIFVKMFTSYVKIWLFRCFLTE